MRRTRNCAAPCELCGDTATVGMTDDMNGRHVKLAQQGPQIGDVSDDTEACTSSGHSFGQ